MNLEKVYPCINTTRDMYIFCRLFIGMIETFSDNYFLRFDSTFDRDRELKDINTLLYTSVDGTRRLLSSISSDVDIQLSKILYDNSDYIIDEDLLMDIQKEFIDSMSKDRAVFLLKSYENDFKEIIIDYIV